MTRVSYCFNGIGACPLGGRLFPQSARSGRRRRYLLLACASHQFQGSSFNSKFASETMREKLQHLPVLPAHQFYYKIALRPKTAYLILYFPSHQTQTTRSTHYLPIESVIEQPTILIVNSLIVDSKWRLRGRSIALKSRNAEPKPRSVVLNAPRTLLPSNLPRGSASSHLSKWAERFYAPPLQV